MSTSDASSGTPAPSITKPSISTSEPRDTTAVDSSTWVDEAWSRYLAYQDVVSRAEGSPDDLDWQSTLAEYALAKPLSDAVASVDMLRAEGLRGVGSVHSELLSVASSSHERVSLDVCSDFSSTYLVDEANGIVASTPPGTRSLESILMVRRGSDPWMVAEVTTNDRSC